MAACCAIISWILLCISASIWACICWSLACISVSILSFSCLSTSFFISSSVFSSFFGGQGPRGLTEEPAEASGVRAWGGPGVGRGRTLLKNCSRWRARGAMEDSEDEAGTWGEGGLDPKPPCLVGVGARRVGSLKKFVKAKFSCSSSSSSSALDSPSLSISYITSSFLAFLFLPVGFFPFFAGSSKVNCQSNFHLGWDQFSNPGWSPWRGTRRGGLRVTTGLMRGFWSWAIVEEAAAAGSPLRVRC
jgi:hypothetical protein